jgi:drug/metabolite transporter (DMT)-like permease
MMKRFYILGFLALIIFDTLAQVSFKFASVHAEPLTMDAAWLVRVFGAPWIYGAFVGYIGAFFTWMTLLKYAPVGPAFAASHLELISVTLISVWLFDDTLTLPKIIGGALIIAGILCLARSEEKESKPAEVEPLQAPVS